MKYIRYTFVGVLVLVFSGSSFAQQRQRIIPANSDDLVILKDLSYRAGNPAWKLDLAYSREFHGARPAFVFIHGGGWRGGDKRSGQRWIREYAKYGFVAATVNYRLTGEAPFPACIHDCKNAIRYLRAHAFEFNIDPARIGVMGISAGGHLVNLLGTSGGVPELEGNGPYQDFSSRVQVVAALSGPTDMTLSSSLEHLLGGTFDEVPERYKKASPLTYVTPDDPPFMLVHGKQDQLVDLRNPFRLHDALDAENIPSFMFVSGLAEHTVRQEAGYLIDPGVRAFFDYYLRGKGFSEDLGRSEDPRPSKPFRDKESWGIIPDNIILEEDLVYREGDPAWKLDILYLPKTNKLHPAVVCIHGGGWRNGSKWSTETKMTAIEFARRGYVVISIDYRLTTNGGKYPDYIHDTKNAVRWLRAHADQYGVDPERIGAFGASAGGHLAVLLGTSAGIESMEGDGPYQKYSSRVQAVAGYCTPVDFSSTNERSAALVMGKQTVDVCPLITEASPETHITADDPPILLFQGSQDPVVNPESPWIMQNALTPLDVPNYVMMAGLVKHQVWDSRREITDPIVFAFMEHHLKAKE